MKFTDKKGREYDCVITLATAITLKKMGVDLSGHLTGDIWEKLGNDLELLVNVLAASVADSLESLKIDEVEFAKSLGGDSLENATIALRDAITDFFPPRQRAAGKKLAEKSDAVMNLESERMLKAIDNLTPEALLASMTSSGLKPESSDSSQANSTDSGSVN